MRERKNGEKKHLKVFKLDWNKSITFGLPFLKKTSEKCLWGQIGLCCLHLIPNHGPNKSHVPSPIGNFLFKRLVLLENWKGGCEDEINMESFFFLKNYESLRWIDTWTCFFPFIFIIKHGYFSVFCVDNLIKAMAQCICSSTQWNVHLHILVQSNWAILVGWLQTSHITCDSLWFDILAGNLKWQAGGDGWGRFWLRLEGSLRLEVFWWFSRWACHFSSDQKHVFFCWRRLHYPII